MDNLNHNIINSIKTALQNKKTWRVANMLLNRKEAARRDLEPACGTTYAPLQVEDLREAGLTVPCSMRNAINRDGDPCRYGVYSLTDTDRAILTSALGRGV